jgi:hypothetical protein
MAPCGQGDGRNFGILESFCLLGSSLSDRGAQTSAKKNISSQLMEWNAVEVDDFLHSIVTGDRSWFHHFAPEKKNKAWNGITQHCPRKRSRKECP